MRKQTSERSIEELDIGTRSLSPRSTVKPVLVVCKSDQFEISCKPADRVGRVENRSRTLLPSASSKTHSGQFPFYLILILTTLVLEARENPTMTPVTTNARTILDQVAARRTAPTATSLVQSEPDTDPITPSAPLPAHFTLPTETSSVASPATTTAIRLTTLKTRRCVATIVSQLVSSQATTLTSPTNCYHLYPSASSTPRISCTQIERNTSAQSSRPILSQSGQGQDRQPRLSRPSHPRSLL